ncbi:MAG: hypothetical protein ACK528_00330 [Alphaproteobacteria bacterium]
MSKITRSRLNMAQTVTVGQWLTLHAEECGQATVPEIRKRLAADTGVSVAEHALRSMLQTCKIVPKRQKVSGELTDRTGVVARSVIEILQQLGMPVPDDLRSVAMRRKIQD